MFAPPPLPRTLEASFRDLGSDKPLVRASAIADVARHAHGDEAVRARALVQLEQALADAHPAVRSAAAVALGDLSATDLLPKLLVAVDDEDAHVRQMAINAVGEIGDVRAAPRLERALRDARPEVRYQAIIAFTRVSRDAEEIDRAILRATEDEDDAVAHIALRVAEERVDEGASPSAALVARARALVNGGSVTTALVSAIFLAKNGDAAGHPLIAAVVKGERPFGRAPDKEDEQAAVELAGRLDLPELVPHLERRAWGLGRWVRDTASFHARIALARRGHPRAVREILGDLDGSKRAVREAAVVAAGRAGLLAARPALERMTQASADPHLVAEALALLGSDPR